MKQSNYNFFYPYKEDGTRIAYNAFSGALALIDDETHTFIQNLGMGGGIVANI